MRAKEWIIHVHRTGYNSVSTAGRLSDHKEIVPADVHVIEKAAYDRLKKAFLVARDMLEEIREADSYMVDELWIEKIDRMAALGPDEVPE